MDNNATQNNSINPIATPTKLQSVSHRLMVFLLLFIFPPLAWWHMWKDHRYHTWFPYVLWVNGAALLGYCTFILTQFYPLLTGSLNPTTSLFMGHVGLFTLSCSEIVYGFYLNRICKENAKLNSKTLRVVIILLFINTLAIPISQLIITSHLKNQTKTNTTSVAVNQNSDPTANWKTYKDTNNTISIKLPSSWQLDTKGSPENLAIAVPAVLLSGGNNKNSFFIQKYSKDISEKDFVEQYICNANFGTCAYPKEAEDVTISGLKGIKIYNHYRQNPSMEYIVKNNDNFYILGFNQDDTFKTEQKMQDQILSTFKFLDENSLSPTITQPQVACTQEARLCVDGSYVSRTGPNCEFAPCSK